MLRIVSLGWYSLKDMVHVSVSSEWLFHESALCSSLGSLGRTSFSEMNANNLFTLIP